jgi:beta-barrel assembly-enhancing protease
MRKSFSAQILVTVLATQMLAMPAFPAQQQSTTPQSTTPSTPPAAQPSAPSTQDQQTTAPPAASPQAQAPAAAQDQSAAGQQPAQDVPAGVQSTDPNVKPGSKQDVNAIGNRSVGKGLDFYSLESEIALGKKLAQEVDRSAKFINDPVITEYVNRVGQNLVRNSDARVPFTIKVIDSDVVNAFALPGGFFYVNSGLILHADEESELAGVMAHEIAHVCARHGTKQATKGEITQIAMIPAMIFIPYTWAGYAIYQGMNFLIPMTFLKFTRDEEREADYLGLQYMYKAGYDPNSFVAFFEKVEALEKKQPGTIPKVFSTHPPTPDRIEATQKEIATILPARDEYIVSTSEFDTVKHRLQMIESNMKLNDKNPNKPSLRKRTDQNKGGSTTSGDPTTTSTGSSTGSSSDDSDRPTLKRRPDDSNPQ